MTQGPTKSGSFRSIGRVAAEVMDDLRFRRKVRRLHRLGDRVLGEVFAHLGVKHSIQTSIEQTIEHFIELDPEALEAAGGDKFWPAPLYEVRRK